jgi:DNA-binding beta-propeller fold protein YncE
MRAHTILSVLSITLPAATIAGCPTETREEWTYSAFDGDAYPKTLAPLERPEGGIGLVTDSYSDTLSVVSLASGELLTQRPVGRNPINLDGPHHLAVDPIAETVFVALSYPQIAALGPHAAHGSSTTLGYVQKLSLVDLEILGQVRVELNPGDIRLSDDGSRLVVTHFDLQRALDHPNDLEAARASLAIIDPNGISHTGSKPPVFIETCVAPHGIALSRPDGATAYVACYAEDAVAIVDLDDPSAAVRLIPLGAGPASFTAPQYGPYAAVLSPDGATLAVASTESKDVRFLDVASETFLDELTVSTLGAPYFVGWTEDASRLYIPTQQPDSVLYLDPFDVLAEPVVRDFAPGECERPHLADPPGGDAVFVVCEGDQKSPGKLLRLEPDTLATLSETELGVYPDDLARVGGPGQ